MDKNNLVIQVDTQEEARQVASVLEAQGYLWHSGSAMLDNQLLLDGGWGWRLLDDHAVLRGAIDMYRENGNPILTVAEYLAQFPEPEADVTADLTSLL